MTDANTDPLGESFESFLDSEGIKEAVYAAAIKRLIAFPSGTTLTHQQEITLPVASSS